MQHSGHLVNTKHVSVVDNRRDKRRKDGDADLQEHMQRGQCLLGKLAKASPYAHELVRLHLSDGDGGCCGSCRCGLRNTWGCSVLSLLVLALAVLVLAFALVAFGVLTLLSFAFVTFALAVLALVLALA